MAIGVTNNNDMDSSIVQFVIYLLQSQLQIKNYHQLPAIKDKKKKKKNFDNKIKKKETNTVNMQIKKCKKRKEKSKNRKKNYR